MILEMLGYIVVALGAIVAGWGLFHQLIVGGAVTAFRNISENEARLFIMGWVAHGAFISLAGILPVILVLFYGALAAPVQTTLLLCAVATLFLSLHVFLSGFSTHFKPIRIGAVLNLVYGLFLLAFVLVANPLLD
ncbi:MAG: hypothetical protein K1X75_10225 [Leptospirales bacterium]|nr:hypothetical protein [Leptospirales bacterium]